MRRAKALTVLAAILSMVLGPARFGALPQASGAASTPRARGTLEARIERQEVCVGSAVESAGQLADVLYYRAVSLPDGSIAVGYFAFFSEERPWGNNWMTWTLVPALAIDLVYSRALLVAPGLQRLLYGKGDVEGFRIVYDVADGGDLRVREAAADDGRHRPVALGRDDLLAIDPARPTVYADVWSHQLGGRGVRHAGELAYLRCYGAGSVRPLPASVARDFELERRAGPAHVERAEGARTLGEPSS